MPAFNDQPFVVMPYAAPDGIRLSIVTRHGAATLDETNAFASDLRVITEWLYDTSAYDGLEMNACLALDGDTSEPVPYTRADDFEATFEPRDDIACWTVYAHCKSGGVEALLDFPTKHEAEAAFAILRAALTAKE